MHEQGQEPSKESTQGSFLGEELRPLNWLPRSAAANRTSDPSSKTRAIASVFRPPLSSSGKTLWSKHANTYQLQGCGLTLNSLFRLNAPSGAVLSSSGQDRKRKSNLVFRRSAGALSQWIQRLKILSPPYRMVFLLHTDFYRER